MEIASVFAINKADQPGAEKLERERSGTALRSEAGSAAGHPK